MSYQAIYRKWRPLVFEDIVGQSHITETLKNQIIADKIGHAYLFCGTRGTGKTTAAKVFARAVNCINSKNGSPCNECEICKGILDGSIMDVTEIDAASNNGVDSIREIREDTKYVAAAAKYRIYIIDEVHMLSAGAFNALLKTLEEPPEHVIFILATTEAHKVPQTILSRCQRFDFKRIKPSDIILRLKEIAYNDKIKISDDGFKMLARLGDGSMRDALSVMERVVTSASPDEEITEKTIISILGIAPFDTEVAVADAVAAANSEKIFNIISESVDEGKDLNVFVDSVIKHFRDLLVCKLSENPEKLLDYSSDDVSILKKQAEKMPFEKISSTISVLSDAKSDAKWIKAPRIIYELAFIKLCVPQLDKSEDAILSRLENVEEKIKNGITIKAEKTEEVEEEKKEKKPEVKTSKKLYNPIPDSQLNSENPIVKVAKRWEKIAQGIAKASPFLMTVVTNRQITVDADGIILLFDREKEAVSKTIADTHKNALESGFIKAAGFECRVKTAFLQDVEDVLVDYWSLEPPEGVAAEENIGETENSDPLDSLMSRMPEIVESSDDTAFLDYSTGNDGFSQSELDDDEDESEEFLDDEEQAQITDEE